VTRPGISRRYRNRKLADKRQLSGRPLTRHRVWRIRFNVGNKTLLQISLRRFRTQKAKRSRLTRQVVIPFYTSYREVAFAFPSLPDKKIRKRNTIWLRRPVSKYSFALQVALIFGGMAGAVFFGAHLHHPVELNLAAKTSAQTITIPAPQSQLEPAGLTRAEPTHLRIPNIGVDAGMTQTGLNTTGAIDMPNVFDQAVWYNGSPTPGETGPSVIVGHVDSTKGIAIFWRLRELQPGALIQVDRQDGSTVTFEVTQLEQYEQDSFPTQAVYGSISYPGIRLITCGGTFNTTTHHYDHNTVVYGKLVN
jgi:sortase (surface protein transpeptidase)